MTAHHLPPLLLTLPPHIISLPTPSPITTLRYFHSFLPPPHSSLLPHPHPSLLSPPHSSLLSPPHSSLLPHPHSFLAFLPYLTSSSNHLFSQSAGDNVLAVCPPSENAKLAFLLPLLATRMKKQQQEGRVPGGQRAATADGVRHSITHAYTMSVT